MSDNIIVGIDPGVGSLGVFRRDKNKGDSLKEQLLDGAVLTFQSGVSSKENTVSLAAQCGDFRRCRKHLFSRKLCKWATLQLLIELNMCPLSIKDLNVWRKYEKGRERKFPTHSKDFMSWLRLDFNKDDKPDYTMFELRDALARNRDLKLSTSVGQEMLGRVIYHMALHRGFRSSKGDRIRSDQDDRGSEDVEDLKESELKYAAKLRSVMEENDLPTAGCALYYLNKEVGLRIRGSEYTLTAAMNKEELKYIFEIHEELGIERYKLYKKILKTVFKVRSKSSNRNSVGCCVFEKNKRRSPKSRPEFEEYRAWSLINNIRYGINGCNHELPLALKQKLYKQKFIGKAKESFKFEEIGNFLRKELANPDIQFNYDSETMVSGCPITYRLIEILGDEWQTVRIETDCHRVCRSSKTKHAVVHTWESLWNKCKCLRGDIDDIEDIEHFCKKLHKEEWTKAMLKLSSTIYKFDGYANVSVYAIKKINIFLRQGLSLDKAVLLANIPDSLGLDSWMKNKDLIINEISRLQESVDFQRRVAKITNSLISQYKTLCLDYTLAFAVQDYEYVLDEKDKEEVYEAVANEVELDSELFDLLYEAVEKEYQAFFGDKNRLYRTYPSLRDAVEEYLHDKFGCTPDILYNHSVIERYDYNPEKMENKLGIEVSLLGSPRIQNLKNPVVLRTLYKLRNLLNYMLLEGKISNDSCLVIETAKELNDANMRWAINYRNEVRRAENEKLKEIIMELYKDYDRKVTEADILSTRLAYEQSLLLPEKLDGRINDSKEAENKTRLIDDGAFCGFGADIKSTIAERYKLWKEQNFRCIYTGEIITLTEVLNGDKVDIEHTLPVSRSLDDSDENKTLCKAYYNRNIKKNHIPSELGIDYEERILVNIRPWEEKVKKLQERVQYWKSRARVAPDKSSKDFAIRQKHLYQMEYDYWYGKVSRFRMKKIENSFVHRQLSDTRMITKYIVNYLRPVFPNISVQKGSVTAVFRKIMGFPEKTRDNNLHHAIDAAVLSLIPQAYIRDRMLKLYYAKQDAEIYDPANVNRYERDLEALKRMSHLDSNVYAVVEEKVRDILVNNIATQRTLNVTRRKYRVGGKVVSLRDDENKVIRDEKGHIIPKYWLQGDSVRGAICNASYYGVIRRIIRDENNNIVYDKDGKPCMSPEKYVKRQPIAKNIALLKKQMPNIVDESLRDYISERIKNLTDLEYQKDGVKDKLGNRIRHIRCYTRNGVMALKENNVYVSKYSYKNFYYVENGSNVYYAAYEDNKGNRKCKVLNLKDVALIRKTEQISKKDDLFPIYYDEKALYKRRFVLEPGLRVILKKELSEELLMLDREDILKRFYIVNNFRDEKDKRVYLKYHVESRTLSIKACKSKPNFEVPESFLILSCNALNFWVEGYDFDVMPDGEIKIRL